jgi:hypothetical protein
MQRSTALQVAASRTMYVRDCDSNPHGDLAHDASITVVSTRASCGIGRSKAISTRSTFRAYFIAIVFVLIHVTSSGDISCSAACETHTV